MAEPVPANILSEGAVRLEKIDISGCDEEQAEAMTVKCEANILAKSDQIEVGHQLRWRADEDGDDADEGAEDSEEGSE